MTRTIALLLLSVLAPSCSRAEAGCVAVVDDAVAVFQDLVDAVDRLDPAELTSADGDVPGLDEMEQRADALQQEAESRGCTDEQLRRLLTDRVDRLEARTVFGRALIEAIRREGLFPSP